MTVFFKKTQIFQEIAGRLCAFPVVLRTIGSCVSHFLDAVVHRACGDFSWQLRLC